MVRTRQMGCDEEALASSDPLSCNVGRRKDCRISGNVDEGDESSDPEVVISGAKRRKYPLRSDPTLKHADGPKALSPFGEHVGKRSKVKRELLAEMELRTGKENSNINVESNANGIRRSTRQRKFMYDTLNQGWLLGSARIRDFSALIDDDLDERRLRRRKGSKKNEKDSSDDDDEDDDDDDEDDDDDSEPVYEDMYSRIKMERRKSVRNFYNLKSKRRRIHCDEEETNDSIQYDMREEQELANSRGSSVDEEEEANENSHHSKYYLRQKKPIIDRFQVPIEPRRHRKTSSSIFCSKSPRALICNGNRNFHNSFRSPAHKSPVFKHKRLHATHNSSTSSCSSSSEDERRFEKRKAKSMSKARNRCLPMNFNEDDVAACSVLKSRIKIGSSLADVDPMAIDRNVTFDSVGGLSEHIQSLKEMLLLPLMYPEVFDKFKITPPRGVLFYGAPGTGKTLVARALANECSQGDQRKVAFFMRKGADCLSKWVGESERQLRLLFDQAYSMRPSIIFFDEIDGLAPVRSTRQDQIHSSIVSTLLALMDGLDSRGEVVIIGATNRIDAIDPALRRPGRFDREFNFPLPSFEARKSIISIHTNEWNPPLAKDFIEFLAEKSAGYCGADIKALCSEAAFLALRRQFPEIYLSRQKLQLDVSTVKIEAKDFYKALYKIVPASQRSAASPGRPLANIVQPLLQSLLNAVLEALKITFPQGSKTGICKTHKDAANNLTETNVDLDLSSDDGSNLDDSPSEVIKCQATDVLNVVSEQSTQNLSLKRIRGIPSHRPRLLIAGGPGQGQSTHIAPAVLHYLERFPIHKMDLPSLFAVTTKSPEECCAQIFLEAQRVLPSVLYLPHVGQWYETLSDTVRATFFTLLDDLDPSTPLLLLATSDSPFEELPSQVKGLFNHCHGEVISMINPGKEQRRLFFSDLILKETKRLPKQKQSLPKKRAPLPILPQSPPPRTLSASDIQKLEKEEESTLRELRIFLREVLYKLARDRRFVIFTKPVDTSEVSDYLQVIRQPMDLETMMTKIDLHKYLCVSDFLADIDLVCHNALEYNPDRDPSDKLIRHRACALKDTAHAFVVSELDPEFEQMCLEIRDARMKRACSPSKYAPQNYIVIQDVNQMKDRSNNPSKDFSAKVSDSTNTPKELKDSISSTDRSLQRNQSDGVETVPVIKEKLGQSSVHGSAPLVRRRKSFWFGCHRRRVISRSSKGNSSDEYQDAGVTKMENHPALNSNSPSIITEELNSYSDEESKDLGLSKKTSKVKIVTSENDVIKINGLLHDEVTVDPLLNVPYEDALGAFKGIRDIKETVKGQEKSVGGATREVHTLRETSPRDTQMLLDTSVSRSSEEVSDLSEVADSDAVVKAAACTVKAEGIPKDDNIISDCTVNGDYSEPKRIIISESRLQNLLEKIVSKTSGFTAEALERLHCHLCKCICAHRQEWDRTGLVGELEKEVEKFCCRMVQK